MICLAVRFSVPVSASLILLILLCTSSMKAWKCVRRLEEGGSVEWYMSIIIDLPDPTEPCRKIPRGIRAGEEGGGDVGGGGGTEVYSAR